MQCEVCGGCIEVTEEIFIEIEKEDTQATEDTATFKFSRFCNSCNKQEEENVSTDDFKENNSHFKK